MLLYTKETKECEMIRFFYYLDLFGVGGGGVVGGVLLQIKRLNNDAVCSSSISNS